MNSVVSPAEKLENQVLADGWKVTTRLKKDPLHTGGYFSVGYLAESDKGEKGFLKALDIRKVMSSGLDDKAKRLRDLLAAFVYERDLLIACRKANLDHVIRSLADGEIEIEGDPVPYIIFEIANSDIRQQSNIFARFDLAWTMRTMHQVSLGLQQLHKNEIAHQDLKPSNILLVNNEDRKIGDLGRSATKECKLEHMKSSFPGDRNYAPPESLYGFNHPEWRERRYGSDAYQLGSLMVFMLTGLSTTALLMEAIEDCHRYGVWGGSYDEVLPYLIEGFARMIEHISNYIPETSVKGEIIEIIRQLCDPDISRRGDPVKRGIGANPFNFERYISKFDRITIVIERELTLH